MKIIYYIISFFMVSSCWCAEQDSQTPGLWLLPRMDSTNKARSDIAGLPDGRLVTVGEIGNKGVILWEKHFDAAVAHTIIADVDGDGSAEIVLSTTDGYVRILR